MKRGWGLGLTLMLGCAVEAAEPAPPARTPAPEPNVTTTAGDNPPVRKPLDLRIRDIRNYMMPNEYRALINAPDADKNTVVVEGKRVLLPMKFEQPVPAGFPPATLWWALRNPTQSWRILVPDLNAPAAGPPNPVPPPVFRWGP